MQYEKIIRDDEGTIVETGRYLDEACTIAHRTDGRPAIIRALDQYLAWRVEGKLHRADGPALLDSNGCYKQLDRACWATTCAPANGAIG